MYLISEELHKCFYERVNTVIEDICCFHDLHLTELKDDTKVIFLGKYPEESHGVPIAFSTSCLSNDNTIVIEMQYTSKNLFKFRIVYSNHAYVPVSTCWLNHKELVLDKAYPTSDCFKQSARKVKEKVLSDWYYDNLCEPMKIDNLMDFLIFTNNN